MPQNQNLVANLEALLFVSGEPLTLSRLEKTLGLSPAEVASGLEALDQKYQTSSESGLMLLFQEDVVRLVTKPVASPFIEALTKSTLQENLSRAALEVLAIIAYRAPITRAEIEAIRGVNCSFTLRNLLLRDLIEREDDGGRSFCYRPTFRFLQSLGLPEVEGLPDYQALSTDARMDVLLAENESSLPNTQND